MQSPKKYVLPLFLFLFKQPKARVIVENTVLNLFLRFAGRNTGLRPPPPSSTTLLDSTGSGTSIPANVLALLQASAQPEPSQAAIEQKKREEEEETIRRVLAEAQGG